MATANAWMPDFLGDIYIFTESLSLHQIYLESNVPLEGLGYLFGQSLLVNHRLIRDLVVVLPVEHITVLNINLRTAQPSIR